MSEWICPILTNLIYFNCNNPIVIAQINSCILKI
jgi:hypothetical protein